ALAMVGAVPSTLAPEPVEVVTPVPPLATATGVVRPSVTGPVVPPPVSPVPAFTAVMVPCGAAATAAVTKAVVASCVGLVPGTGVGAVGVLSSAGELASTTAPAPVEVFVPVPPLATGRMPLTPVVRLSPRQLLRLPLTGVPSAGAMKVGPLLRTLAP